ncbi:MAG: slipin family protein [Actinobacteria bacterium]|nr:slipin family protein [Actinomycetota bacterium]
MPNDVIIKSTHRGLRYEDGKLTRVLGAGRYEVPDRQQGRRRGRRPVVEMVLVDMRERELTIKGQEILTADKVAIRVSILTQFQVLDPVAAMEKVVSYEDRLYSDVQLAARRALASMTLEQILTSRNQLSEDILSDVTDAAASYGVKVLRADVKDLIFPGNLQEIMNRVLTAERLSQAQLVEARTKAEREAIEAKSQAEVEQMAAKSQAAVQSIRAEADAAALQVQAEAAAVYEGNPALLRLRELEALAQLSANPAARIYIGFDKHLDGAQQLSD